MDLYDSSFDLQGHSLGIGGTLYAQNVYAGLDKQDGASLNVSGDLVLKNSSLFVGNGTVTVQELRLREYSSVYMQGKKGHLLVKGDLRDSSTKVQMTWNIRSSVFWCTMELTSKDEGESLSPLDFPLV